MENTLLQIHKLSVVLFLLIYLVKTVLLMANRISKLDRFSRMVKVPEMIISTLFLLTGIWSFVLIGAIKTLQIVKLLAVFISIPLAVVGFKKKNKALAGLAFFLIVLSYGLAEMAKKKPYPVKRSAESEAASPDAIQTLYVQNCSRCHGESGDAMLMNATNFKTSRSSVEEMVAVIKTGRNAMPAYESQLNDDEIQAMAEHLKSFRN